MEYYE